MNLLVPLLQRQVVQQAVFETRLGFFNHPRCVLRIDAPEKQWQQLSGCNQEDADDQCRTGNDSRENGQWPDPGVDQSYQQEKSDCESDYTGTGRDQICELDLLRGVADMLVDVLLNLVTPGFCRLRFCSTGHGSLPSEWISWFLVLGWC